MTLRAPRRGLTLLEMMVTLVIVALVVSLLWQALAQLGRIERLLGAGQLQSLSNSVRAEWVRNALEGLLPGEAHTPQAFGGSEHELKGMTARAPSVSDLGAVDFVLRIDTDERAGETRLLWSLAPSGLSLRTEAPPVALLSWPGRTGRFRYLDAKGEWHDTWPPALGLQTGGLPEAVALETGLDEVPLLVASTRVSPLPLPSRRALEGF
jgi:prepilin-type N-terminal cleavage/methylation domain-containing protein